MVGQYPRTYAEAVSGSQSKPSSAKCLIIVEANVLSADEDSDVAVKVKAHVLYIQVLVGIGSTVPCLPKDGRKKDMFMSFKRPTWRTRTNKRLNLKCCLVFENKKPK